MPDEVSERSVRFVCCEKETSGTIRFRSFSRATRNLRALRALVITLGVTIAAVFIPGAHFVLVPLGVLATPVVTFLAYRKKEQVDGGEGKCPMCGVIMMVGVTSYSRVLVENCPGCHRPVDIVLSSSHLSV